MDLVRHDARRFDRGETADILDLASSTPNGAGTDAFDLGRADLYRIASELDIPPAAIDDAIEELARRRRTESKEMRRIVRRRMRFIRHLVAFAIVVSILAIVDLLDGGDWWFFYVAAFWGIAVALHGSRFITRRDGPLERRLHGR